MTSLADRPPALPGRDGARRRRDAVGHGAAPVPVGLSPVERAVVRAVAYGDVFDWPLTPGEVHRYLPVRATPGQVDAALGALSGDARAIERPSGYVTLAGRSALVETRRRREATSRALWPQAVRYARVLGSLPFVRMVAVTGSLAVNGASDDADVDYLVVTTDGRLWLSRALAMGVVRAASLRHVRLCPNYLLTRSAMSIDERNAFTAHELAQMVPIVGRAVYDDLLARNAWFLGFLPNAGRRGQAVETRPVRTAVPLRRLAEACLRTGIGDRFERWEMTRKVAELSRASSSGEVRYDATCCKGHADEHGRRVLAAFEARLRLLGEEA